jgi:CobQ-like glutamine amidotransferase family enzyme
MKIKQINIVHLYPKEMNIYGDNGNILVLQKRLQWRNIDHKVHMVGVGDKFPPNVDIVIGGGGQDAGQSTIADDLQDKSETLEYLAYDKKVPMLMICGMYQMFGHYFKTLSGQKIPGIGILDIYTEASDTRIIGNIVCKSNCGNLLGYENHSGKTYLQKDTKPLGTTNIGFGNNGDDGTEGAVMNNVFGSYLHGPILAKSPAFADLLLTKAINQSGQSVVFDTLDDNLELNASTSAQSRPR